jgi:hypothetical protein
MALIKRNPGVDSGIIKRDIYKLGRWLEKVCQEGIATERKILEWKLADKAAEQKRQAKVS